MNTNSHHRGVDRKAAGIVGVADPIKESTPDAIRELRSAGLKVSMVTGDYTTTAKAVADQLGINLFFAFVYNVVGVPLAAGVLSLHSICFSTP